MAISASPSVSGRAATVTSDLESSRLGHELEDVEDLDSLLLALLGQGPLRPGAGRDEGVYAVQLRGLRAAATGDLGGALRLLDPEVGARARAVRPLRDVVDIDERQPGDGTQ